MWEQLLEGYGLVEEGKVDLEGSVFVGDAAGRAGDKSKKVKKDHSCSDRDLAANVGIGFQTPEEYFLNEEPKPFERNLNPSDYLDVPSTTDTEVPPLVFTKKNDVEIVLFCGSPGAGKSTFYWTFVQPLGHERVNQDLLKTRDKCVKVAAQHVEEKQSVVVDNTNADKDTRAVWVKLAAKLNVPIRLVHFTAPAKLCEHNDTVRALTGDLVSRCRARARAPLPCISHMHTNEWSQMNPECRTILPKMAFTGFASRYREPTADEGFQDITKVNFQVCLALVGACSHGWPAACGMGS